MGLCWCSPRRLTLLLHCILFQETWSELKEWASERYEFCHSRRGRITSNMQLRWNVWLVGKEMTSLLFPESSNICSDASCLYHRLIPEFTTSASGKLTAWVNYNSINSSEEKNLSNEGDRTRCAEMMCTAPRGPVFMFLLFQPVVRAGGLFTKVHKQQDFYYSHDWGLVQ